MKTIQAAIESLNAPGPSSKSVEDLPQFKQAQTMFASQETAVKALDIAI